MGTVQMSYVYYLLICSFRQANSLEYQIGDLKKNLTTGRSHAHVEDDQKGFH